MQFFPVEIKNGRIQLIDFHGSAHISGLSKAIGFGVFPMGVEQLEAGEEIDLLLLK